MRHHHTTCVFYTSLVTYFYITPASAQIHYWEAIGVYCDGKSSLLFPHPVFQLVSEIDVERRCQEFKGILLIFIVPTIAICYSCYAFYAGQLVECRALFWVFLLCFSRSCWSVTKQRDQNCKNIDRSPDHAVLAVEYWEYMPGSTRPVSQLLPNHRHTLIWQICIQNASHRELIR